MKKTTLSILVFVVALLAISFTSVSAAPTIYYVATNGNDNNPGTIDRPWLTLHKAARTANPGDKVYVRAGIYYAASGINLSKIATSTAPIVFQSAPNERAIIDGSRTAANTTLMTISGQWYEIRNFDIRNARRTGVSVWGGKNIRISGNNIYNSERAAIYGGNGATNLKIINNSIYNNVRENDQYEYGHNGGWAAAIITSEANDVVTNNRVYDNWGEGIGAYGTNHYIAGNTLHDNYSVEIYVNNVSNTTIENNFVYTNNTPAFLRNFSGTWAAATGISIANENATVILNNNKVLNNIVVGKRLWGLSQWGGEASVPTGLQNTTIANNTIAGFGVNGILKIENNVHKASVIANNIFYQTNTARPVASIATNTGITFKYNTWMGGSAGKGAGTGDRNVNPQFANINGITANDFRLNAASPLINRGTSVAIVTKDHFGTNRSGSYDIGAYEKPSTTTTTAADSTTAGFDNIPLPPAPDQAQQTAPSQLRAQRAGNVITFVWAHNPAATQYRLVVINGKGEKVINGWEDAAVVCAEGTGCTKTVELPKGRYRWFVVTRAAEGNTRSETKRVRVR